MRPDHSRFFARKQSIIRLNENHKQLRNALQWILDYNSLSDDEKQKQKLQIINQKLKSAKESIFDYKNKFENLNISAELTSMDDLENLPLINKDDLQSINYSNITTKSNNDRARLLATSGSSGKPVSILRSEWATKLVTARNMILYREWCKGKPFSNVLYFLDPTEKSIDFAFACQLRLSVSDDRFVSIFCDVFYMVSKIQELEPEFISTYPSTLRNIVIYSHKKGLLFPSLKLLHVTSESTDEITRKKVKDIFPNARLIETYTCTEAGLIGSECLTHGGFHVADPLVHVEIIDDDGIPTKSTGRIAVTDLVNNSAPLLRYTSLDDYCKWAEEPCTCGLNTRRIASIEGRRIESIFLSNGNTISPYILTNSVSSIPGVLAYQIIQHKVEEFTVKLVIDEANNHQKSETQSKINVDFSKICGGQVKTAVLYEKEILPEEGQRKIMLVHSLVGGNK